MGEDNTIVGDSDSDNVGYTHDEGASLRADLVSLVSHQFKGDDASGLIKYCTSLEDYIRKGR